MDASPARPYPSLSRRRPALLYMLAIDNDEVQNRMMLKAYEGLEPHINMVFTFLISVTSVSYDVHNTVAKIVNERLSEKHNANVTFIKPHGEVCERQGQAMG